MKTTLAAALFLVGLCVPGAAMCQDAATAERVAEAKAIFSAIHLDKQLDQMSKVMAEGMTRQFGAMELKGSTSRAAQIGFEEGMNAMKERMSAPGGMVDMMAEAYASQFTFEELRQIREFYTSPLGQHMLAATPELMRQMMPRMTAMAKEAMPVACERMKTRFLAEKLVDADKIDQMKCPKPQ